MGNIWIGLLCFIILRQPNTAIAFDEVEDNSDSNREKSPQVEVRAVFINCEPEEGNTAPDSEATRFEREELFKHSILHDCNKKLALTVKITSEPDSSGDEYLPIEHVFEGSNKKRIRLLDPYILRLRREPPLQAYKLRRVDTISGILVDPEGRILGENFKHFRSRIERDIAHNSGKNDWTPEHELYRLQSYPVTSQGTPSLQSSLLANTESALHEPRSCDKKHIEMCTKIFNTTLSKRIKRSEHNIVVEEATDDNMQWNSKDNFYRLSEPENEPEVHSGNYEDKSTSDRSYRRSANANHKKETLWKSDTKQQPNTEEKSRQKKMFRSKFRFSNSKENVSKAGKNKILEKSKTTSPSVRTKVFREHSTVTTRYDDKPGESEDYNNVDAEERERDYAVYEIGNPELWYTVHVQLFEKLSTADGKTVWNDLTKGEQASVSSMSPEWTGQDLNVRYRPAEWIPREEFSLPTTSLCLLAPIRGANIISYADNNTYFHGSSEDGGYIVIPEEDVMDLKDDNNVINKRNNDNNSNPDFDPETDEKNEEGRRKVVVRTSRALLGGSEDKVNIAYQGSDKYLTLPHRRPHHAQIDLEARADENELVRVGASGRIAIAVADSTRRTRTIITLQVGNTGLAAARFRVMTRDCGPALTDLMSEKSKGGRTVAGPELIPPRHTRSLRLELPVEIPIDIAQCSVTLVNDDDKSIAVREVAIKKGDRCFCVWHCDCVCLTDDPKLICREMAESRQLAAGLSIRDRTRHARSACYQNVVTINIFVIVTGVIIALLLLAYSYDMVPFKFGEDLMKIFGDIKWNSSMENSKLLAIAVFTCLCFIKAVLGLIFCCIGAWGIDMLVQMPRRIDSYNESCFKGRKVEYDCDGYPVHPDTRERTVRMVSKSMEFVLNVIFFVSVPCVVIYDALKQMLLRWKTKKSKNGCMTSTKSNTKRCFSTQDMQGLAMRWRRRRGGLRRWMTPHALEVSKELWKEGLTPVKGEFMRPLLREGRHEPSGPIEQHAEHHHDSCADSEQDDTDYVLSQMQKSRESLSILKQKSKS